MVLQDIPKGEKPGKPEIALPLSNSFGNDSLGEDSFKSGKEKVDSLKDTVVEIEKMIVQREKLSNSIFNDAEKIKIDLGNFIQNRDSTDEDAMKERNGLRQKQVEISELQLKEKVSCWQDVAKLKQELRDKTKEVSDKESRLNMLSDIME